MVSIDSEIQKLKDKKWNLFLKHEQQTKEIQAQEKKKQLLVDVERMEKEVNALQGNLIETPTKSLGVVQKNLLSKTTQYDWNHLRVATPLGTSKY